VYDRQVNEFILFPMCQTDYVGTGYLEVYNSTYPTVLDNDNQTPTDIPTMLQQAIIEWIVATGLEARGYQDIADNHWQKYTEKLASYLAQTNLEEDEEILMRGGR
jgi:trans-aconitate methyltransferase